MPISAMMFVQIPQTTTISEWRRWSTDFCTQFPDFSRHTETLMPDFQVQDEPKIYNGKDWRSLWNIFPTSIFLRIYYGMGEYYGTGYERGYLPKFIAYAEWLETNISDSHIWYGNDGGGVVDAFNKSSRKILVSYWDKFKYQLYDAKPEVKASWKQTQEEYDQILAQETQKTIEDLKNRYGVQ